MSDRELERLEVLRDLDQKRLTTEAAGQLLGLERRQVFRLLKAYRIEGAIGLSRSDAEVVATGASPRRYGGRFQRSSASGTGILARP
jgi:predicted DNA-binding protein (UPF0251 family)